MLEEGEVEEDEDDLETGGDLSDDPSTLPEDEPNFVPNQASWARLIIGFKVNTGWIWWSWIRVGLT